jgi:hypothetical protein
MVMRKAWQAGVMVVAALSLVPGCGRRSPVVPKPSETARVPDSGRPVLFAFKTFQMGMTLEAFNRLKPRISSTVRKSHSVFMDIKETLGGFPCVAECAFEDFGDGLQLQHVYIPFERDHYEVIATALRDKLGSPLGTDRINGGRGITWASGGSYVALIERGRGSGESLLAYSFEDWTGRKSKSELETAARARKDL